MGLSNIKITGGLIINEAVLSANDTDVLSVISGLATSLTKLTEPDKDKTILDIIDSIARISKEFLDITSSFDRYVSCKEQLVTENDLIGEEKIYFKNAIGQSYLNLVVGRVNKLFLTRISEISYDNLDAYSYTSVSNQLFNASQWRNVFRDYLKSLNDETLDGNFITLRPGNWDNDVMIFNSGEYLKLLSNLDRIKRFENVSVHTSNVRNDASYASDCLSEESSSRSISRSENNLILVQKRIKFILNEITSMKLEMSESESIDKAEDTVIKLIYSLINLVSATLYQVGNGYYTLLHNETRLRVIEAKCNELAELNRSGKL